MAGVYSTPFLHPPTRSNGIQVCLCTFSWAHLLCRVHAHKNIVFPGFLAVFFHSPTDFFRRRAAIIIKKTKTPYTRRMHVKNCSLCTMYDGVITYTHTHTRNTRYLRYTAGIKYTSVCVFFQFVKTVRYSI